MEYSSCLIELEAGNYVWRLDFNCADKSQDAKGVETVKNVEAAKDANIVEEIEWPIPTCLLSCWALEMVQR